MDYNLLLMLSSLCCCFPSGFMAALIGELATQDSVVQQLWQRYIPEGGFREQVQPEVGLLLLPFTVIMVLFASFAPRINGAKPDGLTDTPKPWGPFTPEAEVLNGRAAMLVGRLGGDRRGRPRLLMLLLLPYRWFFFA